MQKARRACQSLLAGFSLTTLTNFFHFGSLWFASKNFRLAFQPHFTDVSSEMENTVSGFDSR